MNVRTVLSALGVGAAAFVVVTAIVIELLDVEFSAVVGLPVGLLVGSGAFVFLLSRYATLGRTRRVIADAIAGFGIGIALLSGVVYVNFAAPAFEVATGTVVVIGVLAGIGSWLSDRR